MSTITANCPTCQTQYQLQPEQLQIANGKVRCGQCLTVFEPKKIEAQRSPSATPSRSSYVRDEDDKLQGNYTRAASNVSQTSGKDSVDDFMDRHQSLLDDESWVNDLLKEEEQAQTLPDEDESWAESLLADDEEESQQEQPVEDDSSLDDFDVDLRLTKEEEAALASLTEKGNLRSRIQAEPLEFALASRRSLWLKLASVSFVLLLILGLFAQLLYFQFDTLSRQATWRPIYTQICQRLSCQLPDLYSISDIKATQLTVKSNPDYPEVLNVDMVMLSQSQVAQPFPLFELFFVNRQNQVIAARSFTPEEYLLGELEGLKLMPKNQPIHIVLEIKDPSEDANGYKMQLRYP